MRVLDALIETVAADTKLLRELHGQGDQLSVARDVQFVLRADSADKAIKAAAFISAGQYGLALPQDLEVSPSVIVTINMPIEQNIIQSVSGFMMCISRQLGLEYDGWDCAAQTVRT